MALYLGRYKLTSRKNGGQYSGPCYFTGEGDDRFTLEPNAGDKVRWFCRECNSNCTHGISTKPGFRVGYLEENEKPKPIVRGPVVEVNLLEQAVALHAAINNETRDYIHYRGLNDNTIAKFKLGTQYSKAVTIPLLFTWNGQLRCKCIKMRWLPQHQPKGQAAYRVLGNSPAKGIFNFDVLAKHSSWGCIANSLFDIMLLDQYGIPVIGSFAGEAQWEAEWSKHIGWDKIINIGDWDPEHKRSNGETFRPGTEHMLRRALTLGVNNIVNVYPPDGYTDVNAAWMGGVDIDSWIRSLV